MLIFGPLLKMKISCTCDCDKLLYGVHRLQENQLISRLTTWF